MVDFREATTDDITGIVYVQATTWLKHYPNKELGIREEDIKDIDWYSKQPMWQHAILSTDYQVWVAFSGREILGFCSVATNQEKTVLENLFVLPEHQGQGIGSKLLELAINKYGNISLHVATYLEDSINFYYQHGFKSTGFKGEYKLSGGKVIPTIEMSYGSNSNLDSQTTHQATSSLTKPEERPEEREEKEKNKDQGETSEGKELINRKQLAEISGVRDSTIKWYSEIGLLDFEQTESGRRRYFDKDKSIDRLKEIGDLRSKGHSLDQIKSQQY
ncbi:MAG: GNAT family N-acetyltransferase [Candidatus Saccharimonadales bacterium]